VISIPAYTVTIADQRAIVEQQFESVAMGRHEVYPISFARFEAEAGVSAQVEARMEAEPPLDSPWRVQSWRETVCTDQISATFRTTVDLHEPGMTVIDRHGAASLLLQALPPEATLDGIEDLHPVVDWGVVPDPETDQTVAIQEALDRCAAEHPGSTLYFPAGIYRLGTLRIPSQLTVHLAREARLVAIPDPALFPLDSKTDYPVPPEIPDGLERDARGRFIYFDGCEDSHLTGQGIIEGAGLHIRKHREAFGNINGIRIDRSRNCSISGITFIDSGFWAIHIYRSEHIKVENVTVLNPTVFTSDGIDVDSSRHVDVRGCFIHTGDDAFIVKHTAMKRGHAFAPEDIQFSDSFLLSGATAMKLGSESLTDFFQSIRFRDIHVGNLAISSGRAIALELKDHAHMRDIGWERIRVDGVNRLADLSVLQRSDASVRFGHISDVTLQDIECGPIIDPIRFYGRDAQHRLVGIRLDNIRMNDRRLSEADRAGMELNAFADISID